MKKIIAFFVPFIMFAGFAGAAFAQSGFKTLQNEDSSPGERTITAPLPVSVPRVVVSGDRKPIILRDLKIDVEVIGNLAMTTYEMTFHNPNNVVMEGEFIIPLTENQNVSAMALDINGKMREGVAVEKRKARETFEAVVRRGVDPALVEKTSGGRFSTRIYPFNPDGTRRIRVTLEEPLITKNNAYVYNLPLMFGQEINFELNIEIPSDSVSSSPKTETDLPNFAFGKINNVFKASFNEKKYFLNGKISFTLPKLKREPVFTHKDGNQTYFYTDINIQSSPKDKIPPKKIAVVWDSSLSSSKRAFERETKLLGSYLKRLSNVEVIFVTFNITASAGKKFIVKNGNWDSLGKEIGEIVYDGATRFDKLELNALKADEILLFTDGISTFGNTGVQKSDIPVFVINSSPEFDRGALAGTAVKSGGSFINLNSVTDKEALDLLMKQSLKFISYSSAGKKISEVYPRPGVEAAENFTFAGILKGGEDEITLNFGYDKNSIAVTKKIKIKSGGDNSAVARLWAAQKIKDLETDSVKNESEILKLGREYSVVTEFTSLLVLEDVSDYVTYQITPPQELLGEYNRIMGNMKKTEAAARKSALKDSIRLAKEVKDWWNKDFDQSKQPRQFEKLKDSYVQPAGSAPAPMPDSLPRTERAPAEESAYMENAAPAGETRMQRNLAANDSELGKRASGIEAEEIIGGSSDAKEEFSGSEAGMRIKAWDPHTPYMKILKKAKDAELYRDYLKLKTGYDDQPSFFFDVTDEFIRRKMNDKALTALSNIAEMKLDNPELLRTVANKLMELGEYGYAVDIFEKIVKLRGEHPQSYRDLALAYQANKEYRKALETFYKIMLGDWNRFNSVKQIVFVEMNNLISLSPKLDVSGIDKELIFAMPVDIRVVLGWSTDNTDIDLHVTDPYKEEVFYANVLSGIGGRLSSDLTQGFGPEEFMIKKAVAGDYAVSTNNFGDSRQSVSGPTVLYLDIYTFYGTKKQSHKRVLVRTENVKENNIIGNVNFKRQ